MIHRHIKKKKTNSDPSAAPEAKPSSSFPQSSPVFSPAPTPADLPPRPCHPRFATEMARRQGPKSEADVWVEEQGWGGDNRKDVDPARTACCPDLLPRLRKIERLFLVKYPAPIGARLSWASILRVSGFASRVLHYFVPTTLLAPFSHHAKPLSPA